MFTDGLSVVLYKRYETVRCTGPDGAVLNGEESPHGAVVFGKLCGLLPQYKIGVETRFK